MSASSRAPVYLLDTNAIIEAVRVGVWNALCGGLDVHTVEECRDECRRGDALSSGYITVSATALDRLGAVHPVTEAQRASFVLRTDASALDPGELDLYAHALGRADSVWVLCSPDRAAVRIGVELGWRDRLVSLEELVDAVGSRPNPPLRPHFRTAWLSQRRTEALLGL